jgi:hypothetical protein
MSCVFLVSGAKLAVDDLLRIISLSPSVVWHSGESRLAPKILNTPVSQDSGFKVTVSEKEMDDLTGQIEDSINFLRANKATLDVLVNHPGVEDLDLDFAVATREGKPMTSIRLPSNLIAEASRFRLSLTISQYEISE